MKDYRKESMRFVLKTETNLGENAALGIAFKLQECSYYRIGIIVDEALFTGNDYVRQIVAKLQEEMEFVRQYLNTMPEPTYDHLDQAKKVFAGDQLDCVVGIGGGSTIDLAKGIATLMTNEGPALKYRGFGAVKVPPLPVVAIPSTAGSGSEVTPYAVFIDTIDKWKFGINSEYNYPRFAFYDPALLDSCPDRVFASAGMDAMTHTLESFAARNASVLSRMYSLKAFSLLFENLRNIACGDRSKATKLGLLLGAGCAGTALMNSGAGPAGALSYPLGVYFDVPHGLAGSVFLPAVIQYNVQQGYTDYSALFNLVFSEHGLTDTEKSFRFADEIRNLSDSLGIPVTLRGFGVNDEKDLCLIIDNSMQLKAAFDQNPVAFGPEQIAQVVRSLR